MPGKYPKYFYQYHCYNCNHTWGAEFWEEFMQTEEYKTLFDKGPEFNWCTCGCHVVRVTDWARMEEEWKKHEDYRETKR